MPGVQVCVGDPRRALPPGLPTWALPLGPHWPKGCQGSQPVGQLPRRAREQGMLGLKRGAQPVRVPGPHNPPMPHSCSPSCPSSPCSWGSGRRGDPRFCSQPGPRHPRPEADARQRPAALLGRRPSRTALSQGHRRPRPTRSTWRSRRSTACSLHWQSSQESGDGLGPLAGHCLHLGFCDLPRVLPLASWASMGTPPLRSPVCHLGNGSSSRLRHAG
ncbi:PREDICTED: uncharacterized protein LOC107185068 [Myotis davidii]|uniref:uncharacterized protein LOC107185068 n=1 Tax=Myotis davidii TaxID=225400 RepID=UPI00076724AD|nr:PREDICTED: uncharacterized protein LOC107185068 [Myotis davidii]